MKRVGRGPTRLILTVTPNPCVDKTYRVDDFRLDRVHRPSQTFTVAGGKGINVARVYRTLGGRAIATGFLGGNNGGIVERALAQEAMEGRFVPIAGETRVCIAIVDPTHGTQTEVNERGPEVVAEDIRELKRVVERLLLQDTFDFVVLSGSLPPGAPDTLYADLIGMVRKADLCVVLDTSGEALRGGLEARPWMVKPNRMELEGLVGRPLPTQKDVLVAARSLLKAGTELVVVTLGADGALLVGATEVWQAMPPQIEFASAVASGDSFVAAFLWAWSQKEGELANALRLATGAGAANATVIGAGFCTRDSIEDHARRAQVQPFVG